METNSPFTKEQVDLLNHLLPSLTEAQRVWLSGFLTAYPTIASQSEARAAATTSGLALDSKLLSDTLLADSKQSSSKQISKEVTLLYGSQTGNSQRLAEETRRKLEASGFQVNISSMSDFKPNQLKKVENLLVFVSTHGEGDPPDNALSFHQFLFGKRAPKLETLRFAVLSLGDSSYEFFCQTGKEFDQRLEELGGERIYPRLDCDLDFDEPAAEWIEAVTNKLLEDVIVEQGENNPAIGRTQSNSHQISTETGVAINHIAYSRSHPFMAEVLENINLNGRGSKKETRHLELSLEGSGLSYQPGDSLGIYPKNDPTLVHLILEKLNWNANESVTINKQGDVLSLQEALISYFEITTLTKPLLKQITQLSNNKQLAELLLPENAEKLKEYIHGRDILDLVEDFGPWGESAQQFISVLRKIPPRLYSIASSLTANPDEVHLTIGAVRFFLHGRERKGVCSILCAERLEIGDKIPVYVQHNQNFKLPQNPDTPIIMIGPGTGIAPFRSFMQEREELEAQGKSWLFFGDQHFVTDFLYQTEWQRWLKDGVLTKLDVAFSRDTNEKVYVQHRMLEQSRELFQWLEEGAILYVCGDEKRMAHDVHQTLLEIIEKEGQRSQQEALDYLAELQQQKRYQRDVY